MRNGSHENISVEEFARKLPEARDYLRAARIDRTDRMRMYEAAAAVSAVPDELLAQVEARLRREARRAAARPAEAPAATERENEFTLI